MAALPYPTSLVKAENDHLTLYQEVYGIARKPKSFQQWEDLAKENTREILTNGSPSPLVWVYVKGKDVPANAIVAGEEHRQPLYIARSFYEGTICIGKAGRHLERGASFAYNGREIHSESYEVLVPAIQPLRYQYSDAVRAKAIPRIIYEAPSISPPERLNLLKYVVLVDDSSTMIGHLWEAARDALAGAIELHSKYSTEGIDVYLMNNTHNGLNLKSNASVKDIFDSVVPNGETPTGARLQDLFNKYLPLVETTDSTHRPISLLVITAGKPTDDAKGIIAAAARRLDQLHVPFGRFGIQLVQIGDNLKATAALKELDDDITPLYGVRDMVDSTTFDMENPRVNVDTLKRVMLGAIDCHVDALNNVLNVPPLRTIFTH